MSYQNYVIAAYLVFVVVLLWDFVAPRVQIGQLLREARSRATRAASKAGIDSSSDFNRNSLDRNPGGNDEQEQGP